MKATWVSGTDMFVERQEWGGVSFLTMFSSFSWGALWVTVELISQKAGAADFYFMHCEADGQTMCALTVSLR